MLPGVFTLQLLPRMVDAAQSPRALSALGVAGALFPLGGAVLGGLGVALLSGRGWQQGALAGVASQVPAFPGYLQVVVATVELGYFLDAAVYTALFCSYVVLGAWLGADAAGWWQQGRKRAESDLSPFPDGLHPIAVPALLSLAMVFLVFAIFTLSSPGAPWFYAIFFGLTASALSFTVSGERNRTWPWASLVVLAVAMGVTGLAVLLVVSLAL